MTSSASNNSPGSSDNGEQEPFTSQTQNRSLQKVAFRRDVLFENVCCMPSSALSTSKPSRLLQRSGRKARAGPSTADAPNDKSSRTSSESHRSCGKGFCFKDDSVNGEEEEEEDGEYLKAPESSGIPGLEKKKQKSAPTSTEPRGEGLANLLTSSGGRLPSDAVNHSEAGAATAVETADFQVDSNVSRIRRSPEGVIGADVKVSVGSDDRSSPPPPSPVTSPDTAEGNLPAAVAASNELPLRNASSSDAGHHPYPHPQQQQQQQHARSSDDNILWEFSGRRLSNFCRNLMTESVEPLNGETDHPTAGTVAVANEGSTGDEHSSSSSSSSGCYTTEKYNHREFSTAEAAPGDCPFSSGRTDASDTTPMKQETADEIAAASSSRDKTTSDAFSSGGEPPPLLRFLSDSPRRNNRPTIMSDAKTKKTKSGTIDARLDVDANSAEFASIGDKQNAAAAIATDLSKENSSSSPGKVRADDSPGAGKRSARRGRTLERENYESGLLKDFIRPDQKKFSVAPSSSSSTDFNIDTELAIWEPSDYAPDRHKAVPPGATEEASSKPARTEEAPPPLVRSRQTSVSPKRQRIAGRRRSKGSKSVEILGSRQRPSPVGTLLLGRRTMSKEWQILTFTTTEEITTLIRPSATKDDPLEESGRQENRLSMLKSFSDALPTNDTKTELSVSTHDESSSNDASASSEASISDISGATDLLFHANSHDKSDTTESSLPSFSNDYVGSRIGDAQRDISEALSDALKEVDLAEDAASTAKKQSERNAAETLAVSSTLRSDDISTGILPTDEASNEENSLKCERCLDEDSTPPIELDELVKALMDLTSDKTLQDETLKQELSHSRDESSSDLSKLSAEEFLDFSNNNVLPNSRRRPPIQRSEDEDQLNSNFNRLRIIEADSPVSRNESEFLTENIHSKTPSPEPTDYKHKSGLDGNAFDDDDGANYDATLDSDLTLHITEESDHLSSPSFRAATGSVEHIPTDRVDRPEEEDAAAAAAAGASSSEGGSCRPRVASKQQGDAADAASGNRRRSDGSSEVLPEKAFLESVISSLGTIIFLLLAALIFHLFNRFVEHEL